MAQIAYILAVVTLVTGKRNEAKSKDHPDLGGNVSSWGQTTGTSSYVKEGGLHCEGRIFIPLHIAEHSLPFRFMYKYTDPLFAPFVLYNAFRRCTVVRDFPLGHPPLCAGGEHSVPDCSLDFPHHLHNLVIYDVFIGRTSHAKKSTPRLAQDTLFAIVCRTVSL